MEVARRGGDASVAVVPLCHVDSRDRTGQKRGADRELEPGEQSFVERIK